MQPREPHKINPLVLLPLHKSLIPRLTAKLGQTQMLVAQKAKDTTCLASWSQGHLGQLFHCEMPFTCSDICKIILAILLPPLGVLLERGCGADLLINILLTILGYIPGTRSTLKSHHCSLCRHHSRTLHYLEILTPN